MSSALSPTTEPALSSGTWANALTGGDDAARDAISTIAASYWYPVYAWWRRAGLSQEKATTATEASFARWQHSEPPALDDTNAMRLRLWMVTRLNQLANQGIKATPNSVISIDGGWAEQRYEFEPDSGPDDLFDCRWTLSVIEFSTEALRREWAKMGKEPLYHHLLPYIGNKDSYEGLTTETGLSTGALHLAVFELRKRYREILRAIVNNTVGSPGEVADELAAMSRIAGILEGSEEGMGGCAAKELMERGIHPVKMSSTGEMGWTPPTNEELARLFPQYEVQELIGRGGMGAVFKARQLTLDRYVAIKLLPLEVSVAEDFSERFVREARAMAKLSHPNIVGLYEFGHTVEGHLYLTMEFVDGVNLHSAIHETGVKPAMAISVAEQMCEALAYAHSRGVVHRDVKPANVLVDSQGRAKMADFGLAKVSGVDAATWGATMTGKVMGTPDYMAPEQTRDMAVDHRADIYSVGVVLYEMLCQEAPKGVFEPASSRIGCDPRIDQIIIRAMQQQPDRRFQNIVEMKKALQALHSPGGAPGNAHVAHMHPLPLPQAHTPIGDAMRALQPQHGHAGHASHSPASYPPANQSTEKSRSSMYLTVTAVVVVIVGLIFFKLMPSRDKATPESKGTDASQTGKTATAAATPKIKRVKPTKPMPAQSLPEPEGEPWTDGLAEWLSSKKGENSVTLAPAPALGGWRIMDRERIRTGRKFFDHVAVRAHVIGVLSPVWELNAIEVNGDQRTFQAQLRASELTLRQIVGNDLLDLYIHKLDDSFVLSEEHTLELRVAGNHVLVYLDGTLAADAVVAPPTALRAGFTSEPGAIITHLEYRALSQPPPQIAGPPSEALAFNGHKYLLINKPSMTVYAARAEAEAVKGHLVCIETAEESTWIRDQFLKASRSTAFWIGASRNPGEPWKWSNNSPVEYADWAPGRGNEGTAAVFASYPGVRKKWMDVGPTGSDKVPIDGCIIEWGDPEKVATATPPPATPMPAGTPVAALTPPMQWLADQELARGEAFKTQVQAPFEAGMAELNKNYLNAIDNLLNTATTAGKNDEVLALRELRAQFGRDANVPAEDEPTCPPSLKPVRVLFRIQYAKLDKERYALAQKHYTSFSTALQGMENAMIQRQRPADAQIFKEKRESLAKLWLVPPVAMTAAATPAPKPVLPLANTTPAPTRGPRLKTRDVIEKLLIFGARIDATNPDGPVQITSTAQIQGEKQRIDAVEFGPKKDGQPWTDADYEILDSLPDLRRVAFLAGAEITDFSFSRLTRSPNLLDIIIESQPKLTPSAFRRLREIPLLRSLRVRQVPGCTGDAWASLALCRSLTTLSLFEVPLNDAGLKDLARCDVLTRLDLNSITGITPAGYASLTAARKLTDLELGTQTDAAILKVIGTLINLERLNLAGATISDQDIFPLSALNKLSLLNLERTRVSGLAFAKWPTRYGVTTLKCANAGLMNDEGLRLISNAFPRLEVLEFTGKLNDITPAGVAHLAKLRALRQLRLIKSDFVVDGVATEVSRMTALTHLDLGDAHLTNDGAALLGKLTRLEVLEMDKAPTGEPALKAYARLKLLREFRLGEGATPESAGFIQGALPGVAIIRR